MTRLIHAGYRLPVVLFALLFGGAAIWAGTSLPGAAGDPAPAEAAPTDTTAVESLANAAPARREPPVGLITGRTVDERGAPIAGVEVLTFSSRPDDDPPTLVETIVTRYQPSVAGSTHTSDARGVFTIPWKGAAMRIACRAPGRTMRLFAVGERVAPNEVRLGDILVAPAPALTLHIQDSEGYDLEGASVALHRSFTAGGEPLVEVAVTDRRGRVTFPDQDDRGPVHWIVHIRKPGYVERCAGTNDLIENEHGEVPLSLVRGRALSMRLDPNGGTTIPERGLAVILDPTDAPGCSPMMIVTDGEGFAEFEGFPETASVVAHVATRNWIVPARLAAAAGAAATTNGHRFDIVRAGPADLVIPVGAGGRIDGRVINATTGRTVPGLALATAPADLTIGQAPDAAGDITTGATDPAGIFRIEGLDHRTLALSAPSPGWRVLSHHPRNDRRLGAGVDAVVFDVPSDGPLDDLIVMVEPLATLAGRVVSASGDPVPDAFVAVNAVVDAARRPWRQAGQAGVWIRSGLDGEFRVPAIVSATRTVIRVEADGFLPLESEGPSLAPGEILDIGELILDEGKDVVVRLRDPDNRGVAGVHVVLTPRATEGIATAPERAMSDADGRALFHGVLPGTVEVSIEYDGARPLLFDTDIAPTIAISDAAATFAEVRVWPAHRVAGRMITRDGHPLAFTSVSFEVTDISPSDVHAYHQRHPDDDAHYSELEKRAAAELKFEATGDRRGRFHRWVRRRARFSPMEVVEGPKVTVSGTLETGEGVEDIRFDIRHHEVR